MLAEMGERRPGERRTGDSLRKGRVTSVSGRGGGALAGSATPKLGVELGRAR